MRSNYVQLNSVANYIVRVTGGAKACASAYLIGYAECLFIRMEPNGRICEITDSIDLYAVATYCENTAESRCEALMLLLSAPWPRCKESTDIITILIKYVGHLPLSSAVGSGARFERVCSCIPKKSTFSCWPFSVSDPSIDSPAMASGRFMYSARV